MNVLNDIMRNVLVFMFTGALISPSFSESVARWLNCILSPTVEKSYVMERKTAPSSCAYCRLFFLNATEITIRIPVYVQITYLFKPYSSGSKGLNLSRGWIISGHIARHDSFFFLHKEQYFSFLVLKILPFYAVLVFGIKPIQSDCCSIKPLRTAFKMFRCCAFA